MERNPLVRRSLQLRLYLDAISILKPVSQDFNISPTSNFLFIQISLIFFGINSIVKALRFNSGKYKIDDQLCVYFVTFTIVGWVDVFTRLECKKIAIEALKYSQYHKGLTVWAYVIMSNHIHLIISAKNKSNGLSAIIRDYKKYTSKKILEWILANSIESRREWMHLIFSQYGQENKRNKKFQVWQQNNKPITLITPKFTLVKLDYIHMNPVKAGIVTKPEDYLYSSAGNYFGKINNILEVDLIDYGFDVGYVPT